IRAGASTFATPPLYPFPWAAVRARSGLPANPTPAPARVLRGPALPQPAGVPAPDANGWQRRQACVRARLQEAAPRLPAACEAAVQAYWPTCECCIRPPGTTARRATLRPASRPEAAIDVP